MPRYASLLHPQGHPHSRCTYTAQWRVLSAGAREPGPRKGSKQGRAAHPGLRAPALFLGLGREWLLAHFLGRSHCHPTSQPRVQSYVTPRSSSSPEIQENISVPAKARIFSRMVLSWNPDLWKAVKWGRDEGGRMGHTTSLSLSPFPTA